jgi:Tfp pilus assembly protein PilV
MHQVSSSNQYRQRGAQLQPSQGFSLIEVMTGILLTLTFTGVAMQALVTSSFLKVRAQEEGESATWIQENIEFIRHAANKLAYVDNSYEVDARGLCTATAENNGYADLLRDQLHKDEFRGGDIANNASPDNRKEFRVASSKGNRPYIVERSTRVNINPMFNRADFFNILEVTYRVLDDQNREISSSYVEIVPEVSLRCPQ